MANYKIRLKGGAGSGFHGHKGRPGFVGGSSSEGVANSSSYNPANNKDVVQSKMEEWISDNAVNPDGTVDVDKANEALWEVANKFSDEQLPDGNIPEEWSEWLDEAVSNVSTPDEEFDDSDMGDLASSMLADDNSKKYPGLDPYSIDLIKTAERATAAGVKSFTDKRIVKDIARGAAELINSRTKVGYTVYGSDSPHLSEDGTHDLGSFPMVAYGAETPKQVNSMMEYLKGFGYKAVLGPEKYGILVSPPNTQLLEEYWAGQKEFTGKTYGIKLKGGAGSGNHGHKGRPGEQGGSLPQGSSASSVNTVGSTPVDQERRKRLEYQIDKKLTESGWEKKSRNNAVGSFTEYNKLSTDNTTKAYVSYFKGSSRVEVGIRLGGRLGSFKKQSFAFIPSGIKSALDYASELVTVSTAED
jgi:hypothetical protein